MRWIRRILIAFVVLVLLLNVVSAFLATRPRLQAKIFGGERGERLDPKDFDLDVQDITYGERRSAWWMPAKRSNGVVVIVHGFDLSEDPRLSDNDPKLPFARELLDEDWSVLLINLGFATGAHNYTGGGEEAEDINRAVAWAKGRRCGPVVVWGFSAGGHDAHIAAASNPDIAGVASDSAFANTGEIVRQQAARTVYLPELFLGFTPPLFSAFGARDVDVVAAWDDVFADTTVEIKPVLVIHGDADESISPSNGPRIAQASHGELWAVPGVDHTDAFRNDQPAYMQHAREFLDEIAGRLRSCD